MGATLVAGALTSLTSSSLSQLASGNYCVSSSYNCSTNDPVDLGVETTVATTNTPAGNKQVLVFAQASYDGGSTWQSGPTSGSTYVDEMDLTFIGVIPVATSSTTHRKLLPISAAFGGIVPPMVRFIHRNDLGVALTSGSLATVEFSIP